MWKQLFVPLGSSLFMKTWLIKRCGFPSSCKKPAWCRIWLAWHKDNTSHRAVLWAKPEMISHFTGLTKASPVSSAGRFQRSVRSHSLHCWPTNPPPPKPPNPGAINGHDPLYEGSEADLLRMASLQMATPGPGSAAPTFWECFTQPLMQTQLLLSRSVRAAPRGPTAAADRRHVCCSGCWIISFVWISPST